MSERRTVRTACAGLLGLAVLGAGACGYTPRDDYRERREVVIRRDQTPMMADAAPR